MSGKMRKIDVVSVRIFAGASLAVVGVLAGNPSQVLADDWLSDIQDSRCTSENIQGVTDTVRDSIEGSVRRAEAAIKAPTPVGDLSCLNDLMTAPLDTFSNLGGLLGSLQEGLGSIAEMDLDLDIDVSGMICGLAAEKWATLTEPLTGDGLSLGGLASLASNPGDRLSGILNDAFSGAAGGGSSTLSGLGVGISGSQSSTDSKGYSGNIADYVTPDTTPSVPLSEDITYLDAPGAVDTATDAAWALYNQNVYNELASYLACRIGNKFDGTTDGHGGRWNVPGSVNCGFNPGTPPNVSARSSSLMRTVEGVGDAITRDIDRSGGQARSSSGATTSGSATTQGTAKEPSIWELLSQ